MKIFLLIAGAITVFATIRGAFISGLHNNTTVFLAGIAAALLVYAYFYEKVRKIKWLTYSILGAVVFTLGLSGVLAIYGRRNTATFNEDVAIVLGAGIIDDEPRSTLMRRLDAAVSYHNQNPDAYIVVSGGLGYRESYTEAYVMARYLVSRGVLPCRILLEDMAHSTYTNMRYSRVIIDEHFDHTPDVVVITSNFHMYRSVMFAQRMGFDAAVYPAGTPWYAIPFAYMREVAAVVKMWVIGR